ncbi:UNVERIFIED_CONTAM: hypothetical protein Scaly_2934000 [Sesamum calycinum]|uniref:Uncharacterized protein n=1 Tax=Sesamum calycinum TaxID=2727403 RepID=A0AAW2KV66_9LAMI
MASPNDGIDRVTLMHQLHEERHRIDEKVLKLEASVFQLANYYLALQGLIFTTVIKGSSSLKYQNVWLPFFMSLIVSVMYHRALSILVNKYMLQLNALDRVSWQLYRNTSPRTSNLLHDWKEVRRRFDICQLVDWKLEFLWLKLNHAL